MARSVYYWISTKLFYVQCVGKALWSTGGQTVIDHNDRTLSVVLSAGIGERANLIVVEAMKAHAFELELSFTKKPIPSGYACSRALSNGVRFKAASLRAEFTCRDCVEI